MLGPSTLTERVPVRGVRACDPDCTAPAGVRERNDSWRIPAGTGLTFVHRCAWTDRGVPPRTSAKNPRPFSGTARAEFGAVNSPAVFWKAVDWGSKTVDPGSVWGHSDATRRGVWSLE